MGELLLSDMIEHHNVQWLAWTRAILCASHTKPVSSHTALFPFYGRWLGKSSLFLCFSLYSFVFYHLSIIFFFLVLGLHSTSSRNANQQAKTIVRKCALYFSFSIGWHLAPCHGDRWFCLFIPLSAAFHAFSGTIWFLEFVVLSQRFTQGGQSENLHQMGRMCMTCNVTHQKLVLLILNS